MNSGTAKQYPHDAGRSRDENTFYFQVWRHIRWRIRILFWENFAIIWKNKGKKYRRIRKQKLKIKIIFLFLSSHNNHVLPRINFTVKCISEPPIIKMDFAVINSRFEAYTFSPMLPIDYPPPPCPKKLKCITTIRVKVRVESWRKKRTRITSHGAYLLSGWTYMYGRYYTTTGPYGIQCSREFIMRYYRVRRVRKCRPYFMQHVATARGGLKINGPLFSTSSM